MLFSLDFEKLAVLGDYESVAEMLPYFASTEADEYALNGGEFVIVSKEGEPKTEWVDIRPAPGCPLRMNQFVDESLFIDERLPDGILIPIERAALVAFDA